MTPVTIDPALDQQDDRSPGMVGTGSSSLAFDPTARRLSLSERSLAAWSGPDLHGFTADPANGAIMNRDRDRSKQKKRSMKHAGRHVKH